MCLRWCLLPIAQCLLRQSNLNTPLRYPYTYAITVVAMKNRTRPRNTPPSGVLGSMFAYVAAHGYRKITSMSNTRNVIAMM